jgi:chemotaxis protein MotB
VSYADFITLLFAFFVVMYSTSSVNEGKMRVLSDSLTASFPGRNKSLAPIQVGQLMRAPYTDNITPLTRLARPAQFVIVAPPDHRAAIDEEKPGEQDAEERDRSELTQAPDQVPDDGAEDELSAQNTLEQDDDLGDVSDVAENVRKNMSPLLKMAEVALKVKKSWVEIELDSSKLFVSGSARLARGAVEILGDLATVLKTFRNPIQVEGFTDNVPIRTLAFPSNWELSAARAASVVHLFTKIGVDPSRMVAIGYGEHRPVADNATAAGRARNRRVVLVIPADENIRRILGAEKNVEIKPGRT